MPNVLEYGDSVCSHVALEKYTVLALSRAPMDILASVHVAGTKKLTEYEVYDPILNGSSDHGITSRSLVISSILNSGMSPAPCM